MSQRKTDLIRFRCSPSFKAALQREAAYRQITLTDLIEQQLEPLVHGAPAKAPSPPPSIAPSDLQPWAQRAEARAAEKIEVVEVIDLPPHAEVVVNGACEHGRPPAMCWECA